MPLHAIIMTWFRQIWNPGCYSSLTTSRYIHMNPVKAKITAHPEDYPWSSYRTILRMTDDRITQPEKTLAFFKQSIFYYREFVEDATHKYKINENMIQKEIGEDETWLPW